MNTYYLIFIPVAIAIAYSIYIMLWLKKQPSGSEKMQEISLAILVGSAAYLNRQYKTLAVFTILVFLPDRIIWAGDFNLVSAKKPQAKKADAKNQSHNH